MKTRRRKLWGGAAIEGAQGCVIIPSLVVEGAARTRNTNYVTKIFFTEKEYQAEKEQNDTILATVDPRGTFTSAKYTTTPIDLKRLTPQERNTCRSLGGKDITKLKFLNYKYLGVSIHDIVNSDMKITAPMSQAVFTSLSNLSAKLVYLNNDLKLFHNDVHEGNIVFNFNENYAYLIDFGNLSKTPNAENPQTDFQGLVTAARLFAITVKGQNRIPKPLLTLLTSFIEDSALTLSRVSNTDPANARTIITKFLSDFALKYTTSVGGRRKTLRRRAH